MGSWGKKYPNITASWQTHWDELSTFFKYPDSVKKLIYTTNPIESLNATIKRKTKSKGSFPTVESAFKLMYLATQEQQETVSEIGLRFILNLVYFSAKLCQNILNDLGMLGGFTQLDLHSQMIL